ncbi:MAG: hypothetical protein V8R08_01090 [Coriobacteriales bacterium]
MTPWHAERVDADDADCAVGLLVELGGEVGGHAGDVEFAGGHARHELVCRRRDRELVGCPVVGKRVLLLHQMRHADDRRPLHGGHRERGTALAVGAVFRRRARCATGKPGEEHAKGDRGQADADDSSDSHGSRPSVVSWP